MTNTMYYTKHTAFGTELIGSIGYSSRDRRYTAVYEYGSHKIDTLKEAKAYMEKNGWTYDPDIKGLSTCIPVVVYRHSQMKGARQK